MRRARIRLQIAKAISAALPTGVLSMSNVRRHVTRMLLTNFNIRRDIAITDTDWFIAIQVCRAERQTRIRDGYYPAASPSENRLSKYLDLVHSQSG